MSLRTVHDQPVPVRLLQNLLRQGRIPNGMLFWGPDGVGKALAARETAKAVNCSQSPDDACDGCLSCRKVASGNHPDVCTIAPMKKSRIIDVEAVDLINEMAALRPFEAPWRVFVILEAERMGGTAQNHFLKTLEEPPGNSLFILVSQYPGALLPTIRSRCQRMRFGALRPETVKALLCAQRNVDGPTAEAIAGLSQGQMTRALQLVDSDHRQVILDIIRRLDEGEDPLDLAGEFAGYLAAQKELIETEIKNEFDRTASEEGSRQDREEAKKERMALAEARFRRDIMEFLYLFQAWYRDVLVYRAAGNVAPLFNRDQMARLEYAGAGDAAPKIEAIEKARRYLERFLNEERVFRDLFFALAH